MNATASTPAPLTWRNQVSSWLRDSRWSPRPLLARVPRRLSLASLAQLVGMIGALMYGLQWAAYSSYYGRFGLRVEDAGLGYSALVTRAIGLLLVMAAFALAYCVMALSGYVFVRGSRLLVMRVQKPWSWVVVVGIYVLVLPFVASGAIAGPVTLLSGHDDLVFEPLLFSIFIGFWCAVLRTALRTYESSSVQARLRDLAEWGLALGLVLWALVAPAQALLTAAHRLGADVASGVAVVPLSLAGLPVVDVRAPFVELLPSTGASAQAPPAGPGVRLYLLVARSSDTLLLRRCVTVPAATDEARGCPAWVTVQMASSGWEVVEHPDVSSLPK